MGIFSRKTFTGSGKRRPRFTGGDATRRRTAQAATRRSAPKPKRKRK